MTETETKTTMKLRPELEEIRRWRTAVAGATAQRAEMKEQATKECAEAVAAADLKLGEVIAEARENRVPWADITSSAGLTRQLLDDLAKRTGAK